MATMRSRTLPLILAVALTVPACNSVEETVSDVVTEAEETVQLVEFCAAALDVLQAINDEDMAAALEAGENLVAEAPDEIAGEAQTVLDGLEEAQDGNREVLASEEFQTAAEELERYTRDNCDPTS
ncbi:MAG: hypothetical protein R3343_11470 [Nitriliruptorales bacterium]|nr:hypothetical protein [Nitriliruptorales bacterium]